MTEATCHTLHIDKTKGTIIVGYVGGARDVLSYETLEDHLQDVIDESNPQFVNVVMLNVFGYSQAEQEAIIRFIKDESDHLHVETFINHFNVTEEDLEMLITNGESNHQYTIETPRYLLRELLVDAMIASLHT